MDKKLLRKKYLGIRESLNIDEVQSKSGQLRQHLQIFLAEQQFDTVLLYIQHGNEPDVLAIAESMHGVSFGVPVVTAEKGRMEFYQWTPECSLTANRYGIKEVDVEVAKKVSFGKSVACLVPAIAVTKKGVRLGFGGGYYDRYLEDNKQIVKIGTIFNNFVCDQLPYESHDQLLDWIASESGVHHVS